MKPQRRITRTTALAIGSSALLLFLAVTLLIWRGVLDNRIGPGPGLATPSAAGAPPFRLQVAGASSGESAAAASSGVLHMRLSKGQEVAGEAEALALVSGEPLDDETIRQILSRLPAVSPQAGDVEEFRLPAEPLPPPRPGETVEEPFPPPGEGAPPAVEPGSDGPLDVVRFAPEGEIPLAPFLQVTFSQPMVPLATLEQLSAEQVPVRLTPQIPGVWRWLGTQTLTFEFEGENDRFPMATAYTAEIPAGTTSATGGVLAETVSWQFSTPPPQMEAHYPRGGPQILEPLIFVAFNQRVNPQAVLDTVALSSGNRTFALRLATPEEIAGDEQINRFVENAQEERWLVFRPQEPLPGATDFTVTIGPGTPSAEGPLTSTEAQSFDFSTYAALRVEETNCGWSGRDCPPFAPFFIRFNNPLDPEAFSEEMLQIEPLLPGAVVNVQGSNIEIRGASQGRTTYRVRLSSAIRDIFGQTLGSDETATFRVGSTDPVLTGPDEALVTVDPSSNTPALSVYTINHNRLEVEAYAVQPSDWPAYLQYLRDYFRDVEDPPSPPGVRVMDSTVRIEAAADRLTEVEIELQEALGGDFGHLIVVVRPPAGILSTLRFQSRPIVHTWVQVTQIGLDAVADPSQLVAWTTDLQNGAPLAGVAVSLLPNGDSSVTDADGIARLPLSADSSSILTATRGEDTALLPYSAYAWGDGGWQARMVHDELRWYVLDDRAMYRPGEEVHVKGWMRRIGGGPRDDVSISNLGGTVNYQVYDPQGNDIAAGQVEVNALGGFDLRFALPEDSNLGSANLVLRSSAGDADGLEYYHTFQIQEFRRPEFEVSARNETSGPYFVGDHAVVAVSASYFAGGALPNAEVNWTVRSMPGSYTPPNWSGFTFGKWQPWWFYGPMVYEELFFGGRAWPGEEAIVESFAGATDASGQHFLRIDFDALDEPQPYSVIADATVMDVNRQAWGSSTTLLVHPSTLYVGLRSERTFVQQGVPLEIEAIVADVDGNAVAGRQFEIIAARLEWRYTSGSWGEEEAEVQTCAVQSATEPVRCSFNTEKGGTYRIRAVVADDQGRTNLSQFTRWVSGGERRPSRDVEQETVTLIPDKEEYQPGDTAEILVQAPFSPAEGLLTVTRNGILYSEQFSVEGGSTILRIPIEEAHIPNLNLQVDLVGQAPRTDDAGNALEGAPQRPAYGRGELTLGISLMSRTLNVSVAPQHERLEPGGETTVEVTVTDAAGRAVGGAELAVVVVDEAILALTNYQLADPLAAFYNERQAYTSSHYGRASIVLANPQSLLEQAAEPLELERLAAESMAVEEGEMAMDMAAEAPAPMATAPAGSANQESDPAEPIRVRTDFNPLATFAPAVPTDGDGRAQIAVQLPDNLTRYRIMVVAVAGDNQFGSGESNLTARLPLMVRPSAPRFLNFGDRFELPVVLQNQTDEEMTVEVVVQASNLALTAGAGQRVSVPANDRVEVRFPAETLSPGAVRLQFAAVSGPHADAATVALPVYTPATTEAFATYGVVDEGAVSQPLSPPEGVLPQFGELEVTTSSTALQSLTDAVIYLSSYPYDCSEQIASRILAIAALRDVLSAFEAEQLPSPQELEATVQRDIEMLQGLQNEDGGFPIWTRGRKSEPYHSIHATHALVRARDKGFAVPQETLNRALAFLSNVESSYPDWYGEQIRWAMSSYALYVRALAGDADTAKANGLLDEAGLDRLPLEAVAWLWQVLSDDSAQSEAIYRHFLNRAVETASAANFTSSYGDQEYLMLHSNRRSDGVILDALIGNRPDSDLIPKVVNGLLAQRTRGRWSNTQENVFILLALDRYFKAFEAQTPDFVARIWLGETYVGGHEFEGRTTEFRDTDVPMSYLVEASGPQELIVSKEGDGRLYYRLGLTYAPDDLYLDALDMGFVVQRTYEAVDDPGDVTLDEDGTWRIRAGARVRVRLKMVTSNRRYHVALVDPLPAGLEIVNPALAVSGDIPDDPNPADRSYGWWWWGTWYEHQNMRDHRAEAFTTLLWDGVYEYSYIARATTPGTFVVPPAKAEEMYTPEVFGRSASDWVIVE